MTFDTLRQDIRFQAMLAGQKLDFFSTWGLFSPKAIDEGTTLLANYMLIPPDATVLDLGCGYGPLGLAAARLAPHGSVHLVDKDFVAVAYAQKNIVHNNVPNARAYLSNGFDQVPGDIKFDVILSNVPAKIGHELLTIFLEDAHSRLKPGGKLYVVTISGLKEYMKRNLKLVFGNYDKLKQSKTYTAAVAVKE
jgi:16S rRNA (guanine1207-N2)-methyltransferase